MIAQESGLVRAAVTQVSPLRVRVDGADSDSAAIMLGEFVPAVTMRVLVTPKGRTLYVVGRVGGGGDAAWHNVGAAGEPAFAGGWVNFGAAYPARFRKTADGMVVLQGLIKSGALTAAAFTLPAGYRPADGAVYFATHAHNGAAYVHGMAYVLANGNVVPYVGGTAEFSLSGITYWPTT